VFKAMFERVEDNDDEAAARGDILQTLYAIKWPPDQAKKEGAEFPEFTCSNLLAHFEESTKNAEQDGQPEDVGTTELRRFCTPKNAKAVLTSIRRSWAGARAATAIPRTIDTTNTKSLNA